MQRDIVTVERFYTEQASALELKLVAGAERPEAHHSRTDRQSARPGAGRLHQLFRQQARAGHWQCGSHLSQIASAGGTASSVTQIFSPTKFPAWSFSRNLQPDKLFLQAAEETDVPIFQCPLITMKFINLATLALEMMFAPRGTEMGSMVDILGVGVIIRGESGIGKSESVLALSSAATAWSPTTSPR